jgi:hypothetical protein
MTNTESRMGNGGDQMMTANIAALVPQRLDASQGEMVDAGRTGRGGHVSGLRAETYVSSVNGGVHLNVFHGAGLISEDEAQRWKHVAARWQKLNGKPYILRLRAERYGIKMRVPRSGRPHFPIPTGNVGGVNGSRAAIPVDSWRDAETNEICVRVDSFFSDGGE